MTSRRNNAAKRKQNEESGEESSSADLTTFSGWLDDGGEGKNGFIEHQGFSLTRRGKRFDVLIGDAVLTRPSQDTALSAPADKSDDDAELEDGMIARVERIWETRTPAAEECPFMFEARWYLRKKDLQALKSDFAVPSWDTDFITRITDDDLILSNAVDANPLTAIAKDIQVVYRRPESDSALPFLPADMFVCRYSATIGGEAYSTSDGAVRILPFLGKDDKWEDFVTSRGQRAIRSGRSEEDPGKQRASIISNPSPPSKKRRRYYSDESDDSSSEDEFQSGKAVISEGATDPRNTRVGPEHQVTIPKFDPKIKPRIVSRNPRPVWKPDKVSREDVKSYMTKAAGILIPYLRRKRLTHTDPYSPLAWNRMEALSKEMGKNLLPTLSTICTASALSEKRTDMLREVDADSLMRLLNDHSYNIESALRSIESSPKKYVTSMTMAQKDVVNAAFRRYAGSFRMVYKALAPSKSFQDVIDYIYRYKIPDQYRLFQETKKEAAIRMLQSIENRRNVNSSINVDKEPSDNAKGIDWQKTSVNDAIGNLDDRRAEAKRLLLDIEEELGNDKMREVALLVKTFHQRPAIESRARLLGVLHGSDTLKQRMIEFLPKRF